MSLLPGDVARVLHDGTVIPAHPLALTPDLKLDERRQRALTRYYLASGAGGVAVGVHTTQFEIREAGLFEPVLRMASEEVRRHSDGPFLMVAGVTGSTDRAVREAEIARDLGYQLALLSPGGLGDWSEDELIERAQAVGEVLPLFGFYLQPAVGGRHLSRDFWRRFARIEAVEAIKMAPFNRYQTLDVIAAVAQSGRSREIALYTGNDDNIVADLLTPFDFEVDGKRERKWIVGGLLGQWAVWTHAMVALLDRVKRLRNEPDGLELQELLSLGARLTDANAVIFDAANSFRGCIPGIHEVLRRQGLLEGTWCLDPNETMSPGQAEEIDRVSRSYPELTDDEFVRRHLGEWLIAAPSGTHP